MSYQQALERVRQLLDEWRELLQAEPRLLASGDRETVLDTLTRKHSLPHEVHRAIVECAKAGADFYSELAGAEEAEIQQLDGELEPLLAELAELQRRVDRLLRLRRGHEHRLTALKSYARDARALTGLDQSRVQTPQDAEQWLRRLPPPEEPAPAEPVEKLFANKS
ncbi:hypothetical protein HRbin16_00247 [bacterium HR16]|nr:hypothetical protein HRbin16_00247 [bacterium HR16]